MMWLMATADSFSSWRYSGILRNLTSSLRLQWTLLSSIPWSDNAVPSRQAMLMPLPPGFQPLHWTTHRRLFHSESFFLWQEALLAWVILKKIFQGQITSGVSPSLWEVSCTFGVWWENRISSHPSPLCSFTCQASCRSPNFITSDLPGERCPCVSNFKESQLSEFTFPPLVLSNLPPGEEDSKSCGWISYNLSTQPKPWREKEKSATFSTGN